MGALWRGGGMGFGLMEYIYVYVAKLDRLNMGGLEVRKESTAGL
jgi:hypothetical protein